MIFLAGLVVGVAIGAFWASMACAAGKKTRG